MRLKIQTKPPEGMKSDKREPMQIVKAFSELDSKVFDVLGLPYGGPYKGRDSDGQTFTEDTDAWLKEGQEIPVTYYHGFGPDDPNEWQETPAVIGVAKFAKRDERGFWFEVKLDSNEPLAQRILDVDPSIVKASSGAVGHLVREGDGGILTVWPVGELALFDTNEWRKPANDFAVFMAKCDVTEVEAQADEPQSETVDGATEPQPIEPLTQEQDIMEDETKEVKQETPAVDVDALASKLEGVIEAKFNSLWNEKPLNAPKTVKTENLGDPDPNKAFAHYLRTGEHVKGLIKSQVAPMGEYTSAQGGYLVPEDFYSSIIEKRNELSIPRRAGATVLQTNRDVLNIPVEATSQTVFTRGTEISAVDEDEPTIGQVAISVYPYTKIVKVSEDLLDDDASNLSQFLTSSFSRWMAMTENSVTLVGDGTGDPQGIFVGGTAALTFDDTNSIGYAEIPELYYKLGQQYRDGASWVLRDSTVAHLRGLSISNDWAFGPHVIDESRMMGKPYYASDYAAAIASGAKTICFGNWSYYGLVERKGLEIRRLNELYAGTRQVGIRAVFRLGGRVLLADAFQVGKMA